MKDKYWQKSGPGIREQLKDGWTQYYNGALSVDFIKEYLMDIFFSRTELGDRKVVMMTGSLGSILFHDALVAIANGFLTVDSHFISKSGDVGGTPGLAFGAQFREYRGPLGINIQVGITKMYDDDRYDKRKHPLYPNMPVDSARMTFMDFGSGNDGKSNVRRLKVKDTFRHGYTQGTVGPNGPVKGGVVGVLKAGYDVFCEGTDGVVIIDTSRGGELIFDYNY